MKKCPHCGAPLADEAAFCVYCMRPLAEKKDVPLPVSRHRGRKILILAAIVSLALIAAAVTALILFLRSRA